MVDEAAGETIPRTHVLGYLTNASATVTRVRRVTALAMLWIATSFLVLATAEVLLWIWNGVQCETTFLMLLLLGITGVPAVVTLASTGAVRHGSPGGCNVCSAMMWPLLFQTVVAAAIFGTIGLWVGAGVGRNSATPIHLLWLVGMAPAIFLTLLLWDVRNYLEWIARNPETEKPPVSFLPHIRREETMAENIPGNGETGGLNLPRTHVLGYLTNEAATATRVRRVSAAALRIMAVPFLFLAVIECLVLVRLGWIIWNEYYAYAFAYYGSGPYLRRRILPLILGLALGIVAAGLPSLVLLWRAEAVRRGQYWSSKLCAAALWPLILQLLLAAVLSGVAAFYMGFGVYRMRAQPMYLLWLIGTAGAGFLTLLVWDVRTYLRWIARNPQEEKPAVPFLPKAGS